MSSTPPPFAVEDFNFQWKNWLKNIFDRLEGEGNEFITPTLLNSWANYGFGFADAQYIKHPGGLVEIQGHIAGGSILSAAFVLPVGFRPMAFLAFAQNTGANTLGKINITTNGNVTPTFGNNSFYPINCMFKV